jgi:hypothetical protein
VKENTTRENSCEQSQASSNPPKEPFMLCIHSRSFARIQRNGDPHRIGGDKKGDRYPKPVLLPQYAVGLIL